MKSYNSGEVRNIVVMGHSGCGKTSMMEACLFRADVIKRLGKVDEGNTISDYDSEEIEKRYQLTLL